MTLELSMKEFREWLAQFPNAKCYITEYGEGNTEMDRTDDVHAFLVIPQRV